MDNSVLLAKLIGPYIALVGIGLLFNRKAFRMVMEDFPKNSALVFITGLLTFVAGLSILLFHNLWVKDWRVIITVFGWIALIKGVFLIALPGSLVKITNKYLENFKLVLIPWVIMLLVGIFLIVKGYI